MASVIREIVVAASADEVWAVLRDPGAAHRLFPGVVMATTLDADARIVRFAHGKVVRELIVARDDERRRFAYAVVGNGFIHHNASMEVTGDGNGARIRWITDVLPDGMCGPVAELVDRGVAAMTSALGVPRDQEPLTE